MTLPTDTDSLPAIRKVLAQYRSVGGHVTEEEITAAWVEYESSKRLLALLREVEGDPHANITVSLSERIRAELGLDA